MLAGLSALELGRLRLSVGYGTHKKGRPLSPIEVGLLLQKARSEGVSLNECATVIQLEGTGHIGRFLRILELPGDIQHLVDWGRGNGFVGFTSAIELTKLKCAKDQKSLAQVIISSDIKSKEIQQVVQLRNRSGDDIESCVKDVIGMRPIVEKRFVFIGTVDTATSDSLDKVSQKERDTILTSAIEEIDLQGATGRLGRKIFTLVGLEDFDASMRKIGKDNIEMQLRTLISESIKNV